MNSRHYCLGKHCMSSENNPSKNICMYKKVFMYPAVIILMLLIAESVRAQPPRGPIIISPQVNADKTITFRYLAPAAKSVKLSGQFQKGSVDMVKDSLGIWSVSVGPVQPDI